MNQILFKRICQLIASCYALTIDEVWEIYLSNNSIDKTIEIVQKGENYD